MLRHSLGKVSYFLRYFIVPDLKLLPCLRAWALEGDKKCSNFNKGPLTWCITQQNCSSLGRELHDIGPISRKNTKTNCGTPLKRGPNYSWVRQSKIVQSNYINSFLWLNAIMDIFISSLPSNVENILLSLQNLHAKQTLR